MCMIIGIVLGIDIALAIALYNTHIQMKKHIKQKQLAQKLSNRYE